MKETELTLYQKTAIDGEVSYAVYTSPHKEEMLYRLYLLLIRTNPNFREYLVKSMRSVLKDSFEFELDRILLYLSECEVPLYLWINRTKADIVNFLITYNDNLFTSTNLPINKVSAKEKIVVSSFTSFVRRALFTCPLSTKLLCEDILREVEKEKDLPEDEQYFTILRPACFMMLQELNEAQEIWKHEKGEEVEINDAIMNLSLDLNDRLDVDTETEIKNAIIKLEEGKNPCRATKKGYSDRLQEDSPENGLLVNNIQVIFEEGAEEMKASEFMNIINSIGSTSEAKPDIVIIKNKKSSRKSKSVKYKVVKKYKGSDLTTTLEVFDELEEAQKYIDALMKDYPDFTDYCDLLIVRFLNN